MCRWFFVLVAIAYLRVLGADGVAQEDRLWEKIESQLGAVVRSAREGNFQGAWASYRRAFEMAGSSELLGLRRAAYCRRERCPDIWDLARILGRPRSDLEFLHGICPDMGDHRCRRWAASLREGAAHLGDKAAGRPVAQEVELKLWHATEYGDPRPWTVVEVGDAAAWAMIDTGGYKVYLGEDWAREAGVDYRTVGDSFHAVDTDGVRRQRQNGVLPDFRLGALQLRNVASQIRSGKYRPTAFHEALARRGGKSVSFGMNILLRYGAVCFSWPKTTSGSGTLHLGTLGPCRHGETAARSFLSQFTGQPHVESMRDGSPLAVLVDTGAIDTDCKPVFMARNGDRPIRFGAHSALSARCRLDSPYPIQPHHPWPVAIGMDTLLWFEAFGWELDPFSMYFVPLGGSRPPSPRQRRLGRSQ